MTIRENTIAKLQQLPESLLQQVSDFIDVLTNSQPHDMTISDCQGELAEAWAQWFEAVDHLKVTPTEAESNYQQLLLAKYRQQGLEL